MRKTYKICSVLLAILLIASLLPFSALAVNTSATLAVVAPSGVVAGDDFDVEVKLTGNTGLIAATLLIEYDPAVMKLNSKENGSVFADAQYIGNASLANGEATLAWQDYNATSNNTATGTLAVLHFTALAATAGSTVRVTPQSNSLLSIDSDRLGGVNVAAASASVVIASSTPVSTAAFYLSESGTVGAACTSSAPGKYLSDALAKIKENVDTYLAGNVTPVVYLTGKVLTGDPSTSASGGVGDEAIPFDIVITSKSTSKLGALVIPYNSENSFANTSSAIPVNCGIILHDVFFAAYPNGNGSSAFNTNRTLYLRGHNFTVGENVQFVNANWLTGASIAASALPYSFAASTTTNTSPNYNFPLSIQGGSNNNVTMTDDFTIKILNGTFSNVYIGYSYYGALKPHQITCTIGGNAVVTNLYAGPAGPGNAASAFATSKTFSTDVRVTICGSARVTNYYGGFGNFDATGYTYAGDTTTIVRDAAQITSFYGAGVSGYRLNSVTNLIFGGTIGNFYGGLGSSTTRYADMRAHIENSFNNATVTGTAVMASKYGTAASVRSTVANTSVAGDLVAASAAGNLTGNAVLTLLSGANLSASYATGTGNVGGDYVFEMNGGSVGTLCFTGKTSGSVVGDAAFLFAGGSVASLAYQTGSGSVGGRLYGSVDVSRNDVSIDLADGFEGYFLDKLVGGIGTFTVGSNEYIVASAFSGDMLTVRTNVFTRSGAFLTVPTADLSSPAIVDAKVVGQNFLTATRGATTVWYLVEEPLVGISVTLMPAETTQMRIILDTNNATAGQYLYSMDGGKTYQQFSSDPGWVPTTSASAYKVNSTKYPSLVTPAISSWALMDGILLKSSATAVPVEVSVGKACKIVVDGSFDANFKNLAQSILDYGEASQRFFGYKTDRVAEADDPVDLSYVPSYTNKNALGSSVSSPKATPVGITLVLKDEITLKVWFKLSGNVSANDLTVKIDGAAVSQKLALNTGASGYYTVEIAVSGVDVDRAYTVQIFQNSSAVSNLLTTSVGSYLARVDAMIQSGQSVSDNDAALLDLVKAIDTMYHYREALLSA